MHVGDAALESGGLDASRVAHVFQKGMDPARVAEMVLDAIREDRFWIVTHPEWINVLRDRVEAMADGGKLGTGFGG